MEAILFILFYGFTWLIAQVPLVIIHRFSEFTYLIMYYLVRYRRKVVRKNLFNSFPNKTTKEIKRIEKKFYLHLCDLIFENFFLLHASHKRATKRCNFKNPEIFNQLYEQQKSGILVSGHYGNWELYALIGGHVKHTAIGVYKPLTDKRTERMMNKARIRFGSAITPVHKTLRSIVDYKKRNDPFLIGLVADQTPPSREIHYWTRFLNQDTAVYLGIEKIAQKFDLPVYFCNMKKIKRGKYEVEFTLITSKPTELAPYEITNMHTRLLEEQIIKEPEYWLWSHRRWKRKPKNKLNDTLQP